MDHLTKTNRMRSYKRPRNHHYGHHIVFGLLVQLLRKCIHDQHQVDALAVQLPLKSTSSSSSSPLAVRSAYVHIPFCRRKCYYCDFPIKVVGDRPQHVDPAAEAYADTLLQEIAHTQATLHPQFIHPDGLQTVSFGGGTPSLMPPELLSKIVKRLESSFGLAPSAEISIEMDPGTFDELKLNRFIDQLGLTRVSMGVQSFNQALLTACGRAHSLYDVYQAVEVMHKLDFKNFGLDLISGLPHHTLEQWHHSLEEAVKTDAAHVSVYDLQVEDHTAFGRWYTAGEPPLPSEDVTADMFKTASMILRGAGYDHYEISNYAKPGYQSKHNRVYWENRPYLAFGNGAASYIDGNRFTRPRQLKEYTNWVSTSLKRDGFDVATCKAAVALSTPASSPSSLLISAEQTGSTDRSAKETSAAMSLHYEKLLDTLMVGLRLAEGVDLAYLSAEFGDDVTTTLLHAAQGALDGGYMMITVAGEEDNEGGGRQEVNRRAKSLSTKKYGEERRHRLRLTDPEGFLVSNSIISDLFAVVDVATVSRSLELMWANAASAPPPPPPPTTTTAAAATRTTTPTT